jgi:hypothetical protein
VSLPRRYLYRGALQADPAAERFDAVFEPDEARAAGEAGAAAPVITHADAQEALGGLDFDVDDGGVRVLGRVEVKASATT